MWVDEMQDVIDKYVLSGYSTADLEFSSGHRIEVLLAISDTQKKQGLSLINKVDLGMLFCYSAPTYIPFTMQETNVDLDIAHYSVGGKLIQRKSYPARHKEYITSPTSFSFVLETQPGHLPDGDFRFIK